MAHTPAPASVAHLAQMTLLGVTLKSGSDDPFTLSAETDTLLAYAVSKGTITEETADLVRERVRDEIATLYGQLLADHP